jgi:hypothetical protein
MINLQFSTGSQTRSGKMELTPTEIELVANALYAFCSDYDGDIIDAHKPSKELCDKLGISWRHDVYPRNETQVEALRQEKILQHRAEETRRIQARNAKMALEAQRDIDEPGWQMREWEEAVRLQHRRMVQEMEELRRGIDSDRDHSR